MQNTPKHSFSVRRLFQRFLHMESAGGVIMLAAAALALVSANSGMAPLYYGLTQPVEHLVKDGLMVLFFLSVGLELKREMKEGLLAQKGQVLMPLVAAIGGMAAPALFYAALNHSAPETIKGWAIPSATDIAFALCVLMLAGKHMPAAAKILLLALAIFDDVGAILIIALFYSTAIAPLPLLLAVAGAALLAVINRKGVVAVWPYLAIGVYLWFCLHAAGIHTTVAGVAVGLAIPMRNPNNASHSPLNDFLHRLHPWVVFGVMPLFAFTSAGVSFAGLNARDALHPLPLGIALGLFWGKQCGIMGGIFLLVKSGFASLPKDMGWKHAYAVSLLAGIGFTMSLFITLLAFGEPHWQDMAKIGVISGSLLSAAGGIIALQYCKRLA